MHLMVGNHDAYYKNTNSINAVELLLEEYDNVITYSKRYRGRGRWSSYFVYSLDQ